jgi:hypothetical protein
MPFRINPSPRRGWTKMIFLAKYYSTILGSEDTESVAEGGFFDNVFVTVP